MHDNICHMVNYGSVKFLIPAANEARREHLLCVQSFHVRQLLFKYMIRPIYIYIYICHMVNSRTFFYLHRFPKDPELRQRWTDALRRQNFVPSHSAVVCSAHFKPEDIDHTSLSCVRIREKVVPTVFPSFSCYLKRGPKTRKKPEDYSSGVSSTSSSPAVSTSTSSSATSVTTHTSTSNVPTSAMSSTQQISTAINATDYCDIPRKTALKRTSTSFSAAPHTSNAASTAMSSTPKISTAISATDYYETPRETALKRKLCEAENSLLSSLKKIKRLQQSRRRLIKRNATLVTIITDLCKRDLLSTDGLDKSAGGVVDVLKYRLTNK